MNDDYQQAAQHIISVFGDERTQSVLDWMDQRAAGISDAMALVERGEEQRIADVLAVFSEMVDALERIASEQGQDADADQATRTAMTEHLVQALRRELDST